MDIVGLIPSFGGLLWTLAAFVIALSVIVAVHEYGHYIVGRWSGIKADVFSIGFGPVLASKVDKHGTHWQLAALPFGGYVKFRGDSDGASGKDGEAISHMTAAERRATMHGAPLWARAATVFAGPAFNFIMSFLVFAAILAVRGVASDPITIETLHPIATPQNELRVGDTIVAIEGQITPAPDQFSAFVDTITPAATLEYTVLRDGVEAVVEGPWVFPPLAIGIQPGSPASDADLEEGDVVVAVDGAPIFDFDQLRNLVGASEGRTLILDVWRDGEALTFSLTPRRMDLPLPEGGFETRWLIGITGGLFFSAATERPGIVDALSYGVTQTGFIIKSSLSGLYHMSVGAISTCNLSGPIGIAETSGAAASQGWLSFVWFIAVLSTAVGLLNLFPIPVLDGGHLVFHAWEAATGRPPSDRALKVMMGVGLALLLALMGFAVTNDLFCP